MLKTISACLVGVLFMGCAGAGIPNAGKLQLDGNDVYYGARQDDIRFLILTDGSQSGGFGVDDWLFRAPRVSGAIKPSTAEHGIIPFSANANQIRIGEEKFDFANGTAFVVSTSGKQVEVRQMQLAPQDMVASLAGADNRLKDFLNAK
jgi:hypothetical protein